MEKLNLKTKNLTQENISKLTSLFPELLTEVRIDGETIKTIDSQKLRSLVGDYAGERNEIYELTWAGKNKSRQKIVEPITKTLRPIEEESVDFENTENMYIEGDNFEVLKLLQETYLNKIKMIYIDPPYNTGNDFIYKDNYTISKEEHDKATGAVDAEGNKLFRNTTTNGRFHSDWLSMMYERLVIAKDLLRDDGVIFISIDDNEVANLRKICDEIFGEANFIANTVRVSNAAKNNVNTISVIHEYSLVYAKNISMINKNWQVKKNNINEFSQRVNWMRKTNLSTEEIEKELKELVKYPRFYDFDHYYYSDSKGVYRTDNPGGVPNGNTKTIIKHPVTKKECKLPSGGWRYNEATIQQMLKDNLFHFGKDENTIPAPKRYLLDYQYQKPTSVHLFDSQNDAKFLKREQLYFDFPKPVAYLKLFLEMVTCQNDIILDFFSGSATTAHAVMQLNAEDGGNRRFIMVQLPEETKEDSEAFKAGFKNICEIGKERIRRAATKIREDIEAKQAQKRLDGSDMNRSDIDLGFRVFRLDSSNMKDVYYNPESVDQRTLTNFKDNIKEDRSDLDLLFQVLLDMGIPLSARIDEVEVDDKVLYRVDDNFLVACFEDDIDLEFVESIAGINPLRIVFRDSSFADDSVKVNCGEFLRNNLPNTIVKVI